MENNLLEQEIQEYKIFCIVKHYKINDPAALNEYIPLKKSLEKSRKEINKLGLEKNEKLYK